MTTAPEPTSDGEKTADQLLAEMSIEALEAAGGKIAEAVERSLKPKPVETLTERGRRFRAELKADRKVELRRPPKANPWAPGSFNLTEQGRLVRHRPDLAARLKREAGA